MDLNDSHSKTGLKVVMSNFLNICSYYAAQAGLELTNYVCSQGWTETGNLASASQVPGMHHHAQLKVVF
jgi:hypothetical protein